MSVVDMTLLESLLNEVKEWVEQDRLFADPTKSDVLEYEHAGRAKYWCVVRDVSEYIDSIDIKKEMTPFTLLNDDSTKVSAAYELLTSPGPREPRTLVRNVFSDISSHIKTNPRVTALGVKAFENSDGRYDRDLMIGHVHNTVSSHLRVILHARAATLSKRYDLTELLFTAYRAGWFPFGWDPEEHALLCVRPTVEST